MQLNGAYDELSTRGKTIDDIFLKIYKKVTAQVTLPVGSEVNPADPLVSVDGGKTFKPAFLPTYDSEKADYEDETKVVHEGYIYTSLAAAPAAGTIADDTKWEKGEKYIVNGAALITFKRENPDSAESEETFTCAVAIDCELSASQMINFNEDTRVAGFPAVLMR